MRLDRYCTSIDAHCEGEVGRVLTSGLWKLPGATLLEKFNYLNGIGDDIRQFYVNEPRGGAEKTMNLLLSPCHPEADAAFIPLHGDAAYTMSGSNSMCVVTVLLETGMLPMQEPETVVKLECPAGLLDVRAQCSGGKVESVTIRGVRSFAQELDRMIEIEGFGTISVDIAFGGNFFAMINAEDVDLTLSPDEGADIADLGARLKPSIAEQVKPHHPTDEGLNKAGLRVFPFFYLNPGKVTDRYVNVNVMPPARIDRSPCGTGSSARLAQLHARGVLKEGEHVEFHSITGGKYRAGVAEAFAMGNATGIRPELTGRAFIYGTSQIGVHPNDPFPLGFTLSDTWGRQQ